MTEGQKKLEELLLQIPKGKVTTYKAIAHAMGMKGYRYVGQLLKRNHDPDNIPCYKVVQSCGKPGGFALGEKEKVRRLRADGVEVRNGKIVGFMDCLFRF
jgi:methylated-DNA-[protein]-cysteine S-methyltransferase